MIKLAPNLMVNDVNDTLEFYIDILGFQFFMAVTSESHEILMEKPVNRQLDYAMIKKGNVEFMFQARNSLVEDVPAFSKDMPLGGSLTFYIDVEDVDQVYNKIKGKAEIVKGPGTTWYGRKELYIKDCNGYILVFAQQA